MYSDYNLENYNNCDDGGGDDDDDDNDNDNDEHITGLIFKPPVEPLQPPIYKSKYRKSVEEEAAQNKYEHKTLGVMRVSLNTPEQYLRKNSGVRPKRPEVKHKHYRRPDYQHKLPAWEPVKLSKTSKQKSDKPSEVLSKSRGPTKNFKIQNIVNAKTPQVRTSISFHTGDRKKSPNILIPTGGISIPVNRSNYGTKKNVSARKEQLEHKSIPSKHLDHSPVHVEVKSENTMKKNPTKVEKFNSKKQTDTASAKRNDQPKGRYVTDEERAELLYGMNKKWDEMMRQFQALPFLIDTPPKAKRKAKMEEDLKQLEKDIDEIERHPHIYVYDDDGDDE